MQEKILSILSDRTIIELCLDPERPLVTPFDAAANTLDNITTFQGRTCTGVSIDLHLSDTVTRLHPKWRDNLHIPNYWTHLTRDEWEDPDTLWGNPERFSKLDVLPGEPILVSTREYVRLRRNMGAQLLLRSTAGRMLFEILHAGLGDPDWEGTWTGEAINHGPRPLVLRPNMRLFQMVLWWTDREPAVSYADKQGVYQGQIPPTGPLSQV